MAKKAFGGFVDLLDSGLGCILSDMSTFETFHITRNLHKFSGFKLQAVV